MVYSHVNDVEFGTSEICRLGVNTRYIALGLWPVPIFCILHCSKFNIYLKKHLQIKWKSLSSLPWFTCIYRQLFLPFYRSSTRQLRSTTWTITIRQCSSSKNFFSLFHFFFLSKKFKRINSKQQVVKAKYSHLKFIFFFYCNGAENKLKQCLNKTTCFFVCFFHVKVRRLL